MLNDFVVMGDKGKVLEMWTGNTPLFALFISSIEDAGTQTDTHIDNTIIGGRDGLLECGQAATAMGTTTLATSPYSTRLRPISDISNFADYDYLFLTKAEFRAYDVTLTGDAGQDAQILTELETSLSTTNDAYVQSRFRFAEIDGWQPNFFRPSLKLKEGSDIFASLNSSNFLKKNNKGDLSIGLSLPFEYNPPTPIYMGKPERIEDALICYAGAGQIIYDTVALANKIQRYPVHAYFEFIGVRK